jgi:hypothetical protein
VTQVEQAHGHFDRSDIFRPGAKVRLVGERKVTDHGGTAELIPPISSASIVQTAPAQPTNLTVFASDKVSILGRPDWPHQPDLAAPGSVFHRGGLASSGLKADVSAETRKRFVDAVIKVMQPTMVACVTFAK